MGIEEVDRLLTNQLQSNRCQLGDKGPAIRDVPLTASVRLGPMNGYRTSVVPLLASDPIFFSHKHSIRQRNFLRIGDNMNGMAQFRQSVRYPICPHAHPALDRRILSEDADDHGVLNP